MTSPWEYQPKETTSTKGFKIRVDFKKYLLLSYVQQNAGNKVNFFKLKISIGDAIMFHGPAEQAVASCGWRWPKWYCRRWCFDDCYWKHLSTENEHFIFSRFRQVNDFCSKLIPGERRDMFAGLGDDNPPPLFDWANSIKFWYSM